MGVFGGGSISALLAPGLPKAMLSPAVAAKMVTSCGTIAMRSRTRCGSASRISTPSISTAPFSGS
jgi:NAD(P)H-hydrate repair Nnr-like enzyme with NAD(P)H-hydrate dehydratase domain